MIEKPTPDVLTLSTTFYDVSVSRNLFAKAEMRLFGASGTDGLIYLILRLDEFRAGYVGHEKFAGADSLLLNTRGRDVDFILMLDRDSSA